MLPETQDSARSHMVKTCAVLQRALACTTVLYSDSVQVIISQVGFVGRASGGSEE